MTDPDALPTLLLCLLAAIGSCWLAVRLRSRGFWLGVLVVVLTWGAGALVLSSAVTSRLLVGLTVGIVAGTTGGVFGPLATRGLLLYDRWMHERFGSAPAATEDSVPRRETKGRHLGRDLFALVTMLLFSGGPFVGAGYALGEYVFRFPDDAPLRDQPSLVLFLAVRIGVGVPLCLAGRSLWLWAMSRFLSREIVAPFVSHGSPRWLTRWDEALLRRFYGRGNAP